MADSPGPAFIWGFIAVCAWIGLVITVSIFYRRSRGKPIWYRDDEDALFLEKRASGNSHRTWYTKLGGARNALAVAVTPSHLVVRPLFPFNLMFLPEIYGLEATVPLDQVRAIEHGRQFGRDVVDVEFEGASGEVERYSLGLRRQDEFLSALDRAQRSSIRNAVR